MHRLYRAIYSQAPNLARRIQSVATRVQPQTRRLFSTLPTATTAATASARSRFASGAVRWGATFALASVIGIAAATNQPKSNSADSAPPANGNGSGAGSPGSAAADTNTTGRDVVPISEGAPTGSSVYTFGGNLFGQCATGGESLSQPIPQSIGIAAARIGAGGDSSFAISHPSSQRHSLWSWGRGRYGTLGHAATNNISVPRAVPEFDAHLISIDSAEFHSAAVDRSGKLYVWGSRTFLDSIPQSNTPALVDPKLFQNEQIRSVAVGRSHTLALTASGHVYSFGAGHDGTLRLC